MRYYSPSSVCFFLSDFSVAVALGVLVLGSVVPRGVQGQTTIYDEPFNYSDGTTAPGDGSWALTQNGLSPDVFSVQSNELQLTDASDGQSGGVEFETETIDFSSFSTVDFSFDISENGDHESSDFVDVEYSTDGGSTFTKITDWNGNGDASHTLTGNWSNAAVTQSGISGNSLVLRVTMRNNGNTEDILLDNVEVTSSPTVQFTASSGTVNEGEAATNLSVEILDPPSGTSVSADVVFNSGASSASLGDVNNFGTKSVTFPSGASDGALRSVTVSLTGDGAAEGSETAVFDLKNVSGGSATAGSPVQFDLAIQDVVSDHSGDVLITEVLQNPGAVGDSDGEYVELYNATTGEIDLSGWSIEDKDGDSDDLSGTVPARGFAVLCKNDDSGSNGGLRNCSLDYANRIDFENGGDVIRLLDGDANEVDQVNYDGGTNWPDPDGQAMVFTGTTDNNTGSNWSTATRRERGFALDQSGDDGSPGRSGDQQSLQPSTEVTGSAGWRLLSAPIAGVDADVLAEANLVQGVSGHFPNADPNLWQWTGGNNADWSVPSPTDDLTGSGAPTGDAGGFIWYLFGTAETPSTDPPPFTLSLPGATRTGDVTPSGLDANRTFHLLGNPFAQAIDVSGLNLVAQNFSTTVQVWDPSAGSYVDVTQSSGADDLIGPYQGFFVERSSGSATSLAIPASSRRADPVSLKRVEEGPPRIEFRLIGRSESDSVLTRDEALTLYAHPEATTGWDVYDASKLTPLSGRYVTAAFEGTRDGEPALKAVASVPMPVGEGGVEFPITLATHGAGAVDRFTLAWPSWTGVPEGWTLTLHDTVADSTVNLRRHSGYTFVLPDPAKYDVGEAASRDGLAPPRSPAALQRSVRAKADTSAPRFILRLDSGEIPVELTRFDATRRADAVVLRWATASETNNAGFTVEQRGPGTRRFQPLGFVDGAGTTDRTQRYRFQTSPLEAGRHTFRLRQVDLDGSASVSDTVAVTVPLDEPGEVTVAPTPVSGTTTVRLRVRKKQNVRLFVYDSLGRRIRTVYRGPVVPGQLNRYAVDASDFASGTYFLRVIGTDFQETRRFVVVR